MKKPVTITFEDHGQDFLEWDVFEGKVVACRPAVQGWVWIGHRVLNDKLAVGDKVRIEKEPGTEQTQIKYPITDVRPYKAWGWEIEVSFQVGPATRFHKQGSASLVRRWGMMKSLAREVRLIEPYTREQWIRAFGDGRIRM